jgi:heavy metal translocating P-type ATPase
MATQSGTGYSVTGTQYALQSAAASSRATASCHFCGLPLNDGGGAAAANEPRYCCHGCRFAASIAAADGDEGQARWAMTRLGLAVFFAMNVMVFTMLLWSQPEARAAADWALNSSPSGFGLTLAAAWYDLARYACLLFTLPVVLLLGSPLATEAIEELCRGRPSLSLLLCLGIAASLAYSIWSLLAGSGHVYFEVAATILVAVTLGRWLEATGKLKTTAALRGLAGLLPDKVRICRAGSEELIPSADLAMGDVFRVLPGERVAADGTIVRHEAAVDEQALTGESLPVVRRAGDRLMSGTLVLDGPLEIRATAPAGEGTLARMIAAVTAATAARTRYERLAEQISRWFLWAIMLIACGTFAVHAWLGDYAAGLLAALAVLVIACPCALGLATPMALWAAIGRAAQSGVLIRDGDALSHLAQAKTICFDKTGTLTTGEALVESVQVDPCSTTEECLQIASALSRNSSHPLALAISRFAKSQLVNTTELTAERTLVRAGRGIAGYVAAIDCPAFLGSRVWLASCSQSLSHQLLATEEGATDGAAAETLLAWDGQARARFTFQERLRPEAETTVHLLRSLGLSTMILTGDRQPRALSLAGALGMEYRAQLLPEAKLSAIREFQAKQGPVVMVGDGINDAPALAAADVGIALGSGTDISRHSAGICLLTSDLSRLPWIVELARQTERTIRWNLVWAFGYNVIGVGIAAAGWLHPIVAALAMGVSSLLVVTNSLALARFQPDSAEQHNDVNTGGLPTAEGHA